MGTGRGGYELKVTGITAPRQLKKAPDALLLHNFPLESHARHYLVATHVRDMMKTWGSAQPQPDQGNTALAAAISGLMQEQRALRQSKKRYRSDPDAEALLSLEIPRLIVLSLYKHEKPHMSRAPPWQTEHFEIECAISIHFCASKSDQTGNSLQTERISET